MDCDDCAERATPTGDEYFGDHRGRLVPELPEDEDKNAHLGVGQSLHLLVLVA